MKTALIAIFVTFGLSAASLHASVVRPGNGYGSFSTISGGATSGTSEGDGITEWLVCKSDSGVGPSSCDGSPTAVWDILIEVDSTTPLSDGITLTVPNLDTDNGLTTPDFGLVGCTTPSSGIGTSDTQGVPCTPVDSLGNPQVGATCQADLTTAVTGTSVELPASCAPTDGITVFYIDETAADLIGPNPATAAPEPSSLALLAAGLLGLLRLRRRLT